MWCVDIWVITYCKAILMVTILYIQLDLLYDNKKTHDISTYCAHILLVLYNAMVVCYIAQRARLNRLTCVR